MKAITSNDAISVLDCTFLVIVMAINTWYMISIAAHETIVLLITCWYFISLIRLLMSHATFLSDSMILIYYSVNADVILLQTEAANEKVKPLGMMLWFTSIYDFF